ncbi:MAG: nucleoside monophosphate kinase [bacterium]
MADAHKKWKSHDQREPHVSLNNKKILLMGPPGCGKSTQAHSISVTYNIPHISAGRLLKDTRDVETEYGRPSDYMERGELVPNPLVNRLVHFRVNDATEFVLEGYPRNVSQQEYLEGVTEINRMIVLDLPEREILERLTARRICEDCGTIFNNDFSPPEKAGVCDRCGGNLYRRKDDRPDAVKHRFEVYEHRTRPVLERYQKRPGFVRIDATGTTREVWERIRSTIVELPAQTRSTV